MSPWDEKRLWNKQNTPYFKKLLRGTRLIKDDTEDGNEARIEGFIGKTQMNLEDQNQSVNDYSLRNNQSAVDPVELAAGIRSIVQPTTAVKRNDGMNKDYKIKEGETEKGSVERMI